MKSILAAFSSLTLVLAASCPVSDAGAASDTQILNFALTLEHLENAFYNGALSKYDEGAFADAGYPSWVRRRFEEISAHEAAHVATLEKVLGDQAVQPCDYNFPYSNPQSFIALSMVLEGVGVSAYLGAAKLISNPDYLAAAATILTTEARHNAWVSSAVRKQAAWSGPFDVALSSNQVYSIAAAFIGSCPSTNPPLSVQAAPALSVDSCSYEPGSTIDVSYDATPEDGETHYLALYGGQEPTYVPLSCDNQADLPFDLFGLVYAVVTTTEGIVSDATTVAGPALLFFPDSD